MSRLFNFDANASYGVTPYVRDGLQRLGDDLLNPNSVHRGGQQARAQIERAREQVAKLLGVGANSRVVFTSGATEANNTALRIPFQYRRGEGSANELIVSAVEHPSVLETARALKRHGVQVAEIQPEENCGISQAELLAKLNENTKLVSIMSVNNETGEIFPLTEMVSAIRAKSPYTLIHSDAVQAAGKVKIDFERSGLDMLTISGHKIGALTGVGVLVVGRRVPFEPLLHGGVQELHHRAGTENVLGIASLGFAAAETMREMDSRSRNTSDCRAHLIEKVRVEFPDIQMNTPLERSVSNTINMRIPGVLADDLVVALDQRGILISSGAACASGKPEASHVLRALGLSESQAKESIRVSLRGDCTADQVDCFVEEFGRAVSWMRQVGGAVVGL